MQKLLLVAFVAILGTGCDELKKTIDPTGKAYVKDSTATPAKPTATTSSPAAGKPNQPATAATPTPAPTPPPAPVAARPSATGAKEVPIRTKAPGRFLTIKAVESQLHEINFRVEGRNFRFVGNVFADRSGITSLRDATGRLWGLAIGDLNMDGSDDAALLLRTDHGGGRVSWDVAYLPNRDGRLFNVQSLTLAGDQGFREMVIEGSTILLVPAVDGPNVRLGYAGGEIVQVAN